jgi:hypothetical protein
MYVTEQTDRGRSLRAEDGQALLPVRSAKDGGFRRGEGLLPPFANRRSRSVVVAHPGHTTLWSSP